MIGRGVTAFLVASTLAASAQALDTFLWPPSFERAEAGAMLISLSSTAQFPRFEAGPQADRIASTSGLAVFDRTEEALRLALIAPQIGVNVASVTLAPQDVERRDAEAARYLDEIGASPAARTAFEAMPAPGVLRETYTRYAKTIFCVTNCLQLARAIAKSGHALEFVVFAGRDGVTFRRFVLYRQGVAAADQPVVAVTTDGQRRMLRTDAQGLLALPDDVRGPTLLSATILRPPEGAEGRFLSDVATLTFIAP